MLLPESLSYGHSTTATESKERVVDSSQSLEDINYRSAPWEGLSSKYEFDFVPDQSPSEANEVIDTFPGGIPV
jgi:hypothetical protein